MRWVTALKIRISCLICTVVKPVCWRIVKEEKKKKKKKTFVLSLVRCVVNAMKGFLKINQKKQSFLFLGVAMMNHIYKIHNYTSNVVLRKISFLFCTDWPGQNRFYSFSYACRCQLIEYWEETNWSIVPWKKRFFMLV